MISYGDRNSGGELIVVLVVVVVVAVVGLCGNSSGGCCRMILKVETFKFIGHFDILLWCVLQCLMVNLSCSKAGAKPSAQAAKKFKCKGGTWCRPHNN